MEPQLLSVAMSRSDRTNPILDGRAHIPGVVMNPVQASIEEIFARQVAEARYDVAELSLASYLIALDSGETRLTAIPAFLSRSFRHNALYVRADSPFHHPTDLKGHRFGFPEFQMTAAVWVRGWFRHEWDTQNAEMDWVTYRPERIPITVPAVRGTATDLFEGLVTGEVAAVMSARRPPLAYFPPSGRGGSIRRLYDDAWSEERAFYRKTGVFPIMHLVSLRTDTATSDANLPRRVYDALLAAKDEATANLTETIKLGAAAPWLVESMEMACDVIGLDVWPYGVKQNWAQLEAFMGFMVEDGLLSAPLPKERVFHASVLDT